MKIKNIKIITHGYVQCINHVFILSKMFLHETLNYSFSVGINKLTGEIDSSYWGISYLISMYPYFSSLEKKIVFITRKRLGE